MMQIRLLLHGQCSERDSGSTLGCYDERNNSITLHIGRIWRDTQTEDEFIFKFGKCISHESLHHCIMSIVRIDTIDLQGLPHCKNEWIVNQLLEEKMTETYLISYAVNDAMVSLSHKVYKEAFSYTRKFMIMYIIIHILLTSIAIILLRW